MRGILRSRAHSQLAPRATLRSNDEETSEPQDNPEYLDARGEAEVADREAHHARTRKL